MSLTGKQTDFVAYYSDPGSKGYNNASKSAEMAGYSKKTAKAIGQENLTKPVIADAVKAYKAKIADKIEITREFVIKELMKIINTAARESDKTAALRQLCEIMGYNKEPAENPENIERRQAKTEEETALIREVAQEMVSREAAKRDDSPIRAIKIG